MSLSETIAEVRKQLTHTKEVAQVSINELEQIVHGNNLIIEAIGNKVSVNKQLEAVFITTTFSISMFTDAESGVFPPKIESYTTIMDIPEKEELSSVVLRGVRECRIMLLSQKFGVKVAQEKKDSLSPTPFGSIQENKENQGFKSINSLAASTL